MPKFEVKKSINIAASAERIFNTLNDFNHWQVWSPWLILEPDVTVTVQPNAKEYSWEGKLVGSGEMKLTKEVQHSRIEYDLTFLKPWKSEAKIAFEFVEKGDSTEVSWFMESKLPFFMFFMKKSMTAYIGMDYERGLKMLKDYIEDGNVHSKVTYKGESQMDAFEFIGIKNSTTMANLPEKMSKDFGDLMTFIEGKEFVAGAPYAQYTKMDMVVGNMDYVAGIPVSKIPQDLPNGFISGNIGASKIATVEHIGPYHHLGNAWGMMSMMVRNKVVKQNKTIAPFEIYVSNPQNVDPYELVTNIVYAVK